jgi:hypothetical protein
MISRKLLLAFSVAIFATAGCGSDPASLLRLLIPAAAEAASAGDFVDQGAFELRPLSLFSSETCPVWVDDSGVVYHLFQAPDLSNADFDRITQPGVRSRLLLTERQDLAVGCLGGPVVQVQQVLEVTTP